MFDPAKVDVADAVRVAHDAFNKMVEELRNQTQQQLAEQFNVDVEVIRGVWWVHGGTDTQSDEDAAGDATQRELESWQLQTKGN